MFDVHTESQLLENSPLGLDDLRLQGNVDCVQDHGLDGTLGANLLDVGEHVDHVANASRGFFDFRRQTDTTHGGRLHAVANE